MADFTNIPDQGQYFMMSVAFVVSVNTATVVMVADSIGDIVDPNTGETLTKGLATLCKEDGITDYLIHKF